VTQILKTPITNFGRPSRGGGLIVTVFNLGRYESSVTSVESGMELSESEKLNWAGCLGLKFQLGGPIPLFRLPI
jgi:hypothetical protein